MSYRTINISKPCKISVKNHNFLYSPVDDNAISVPISDISIVILETKQVVITSPLLSKMAKHNILLFSTDESHVPNGVFTPFHQHSRFTLVSHLQVEMSIPLKKKLWQSIIKQKIYNQGTTLEQFKTEGHKELILLSKSVKSGDSSNIESYSAKAYWSYLFVNFNRRDILDWRNSALNYGYSIIRGAIARTISANGLIPAFGLHHHNQLNAFNLVDDMIEPFRCFVDMIVFTILKREKIIPYGTILSKEHRVELLKVFQIKVNISNIETDLLNAVKIAVNSLICSIKEKQQTLELPSISRNYNNGE